jgi:hypothetical protein
MSFEFNFVADKTIKGRIYPALAKHEARPYTPSWREFGQHWPYTTPLRLQEYCDKHKVKVNTYSINDNLPSNTFYPICLGFFDFDIDYFGLLPVDVHRCVVAGRLKILFYYHEGDNPRRIKNRLDSLCQHHDLDPKCYVFVSSNTQADSLPGFVTFIDFELWYGCRNTEAALPIHTNARNHEFAALCRLHKSWRATIMADMIQAGTLDQSLWSYCETITGDLSNDNPIEIDMIPQLRWNIDKFVKLVPKFSDDLDQLKRNDHSMLVPKYFNDVYCAIAIESQFDVDQSNGAFITEKTFKSIKHGQMFFIAGAAGSLQTLRNIGYRTFDHVLDNSYDTITNHTQRWQRLHESIQQARSQGLDNLFLQCLPDIEHNQKLFLASKQDRLNILHRKIHEQHN